jgi:16S rRNA U516 pseudouridylate synthase RsuA-like enzyme
MLITDDGEFAHNILSPRKHVKKEYPVGSAWRAGSSRAEQQALREEILSSIQI